METRLQFHSERGNRLTLCVKWFLSTMSEYQINLCLWERTELGTTSACQFEPARPRVSLSKADPSWLIINLAGDLQGFYPSRNIHVVHNDTAGGNHT